METLLLLTVEVMMRPHLPRPPLPLLAELSSAPAEQEGEPCCSQTRNESFLPSLTVVEVVVEVVEELRYATARSLYHSHQHSDQTHQG